MARDWSWFTGFEPGGVWRSAAASAGDTASVQDIWGLMGSSASNPIITNTRGAWSKHCSRIPDLGVGYHSSFPGHHIVASKDYLWWHVPLQIQSWLSGTPGHTAGQNYVYARMAVGAYGLAGDDYYIGAGIQIQVDINTYKLVILTFNGIGTLQNGYLVHGAAFAPSTDWREHVVEMDLSGYPAANPTVRHWVGGTGWSGTQLLPAPGTDSWYVGLKAGPDCKYVGAKGTDGRPELYIDDWGACQSDSQGDAPETDIQSVLVQPNADILTPWTPTGWPEHYRNVDDKNKTSPECDKTWDSGEDLEEDVDLTETQIDVTTYGPFDTHQYIKISGSAEVMQITGQGITSGTQEWLAVSRGALGTTPTTHSDGASILHHRKDYNTPTVASQREAYGFADVPSGTVEGVRLLWEDKASPLPTLQGRINPAAGWNTLTPVNPGDSGGYGFAWRGHQLAQTPEGTPAAWSTAKLNDLEAALVASSDLEPVGEFYALAIGENVARPAANVCPDLFVELSGTVPGVSALTGEVYRKRPLNGSVDVAASLAGEIFRTRPLSGQIDTEAALSGILSCICPLSGLIAAVSTVNGDLLRTRSMSGSVDIVSALSGNLNLIRGLSGIIAAVSALSGEVYRLRPMSGSIDAISALVGELYRTKELTGQIDAVASLSGNLYLVWGLSGTVACVSDLTGDLFVIWHFQGDIAIVSVLSGSLTILRRTPPLADAYAKARHIPLFADAWQHPKGPPDG